MKKHSGEVCLYNLIFPFFSLFLFSPLIWLFLIIGNFLVDSLVLWIANRITRSGSFQAIWKKSIIRIVFSGFLADLVGSLASTVFFMIFDVGSPYFWPGSFYNAIPGIILAAILIYLLNRTWCLRQTGIKKKDRIKIALLMAILTAPYTMMISTNWLMTVTGTGF